MAATAGEWLTVTAGADENSVKHQCKIAYDASHEKMYTPAFNWAVMGDFTITVSTHATDTGAAEDATRATHLDVEGSVDGTNYVELAEKDNIHAASVKAGIYVYDFDSKGLMPHMRISVDPQGGNTSQSLYITVTPHHMV